MKTIKQYIEFYNNDENVLIGIQQNNGMNCREKDYVPSKQALTEFDGWLDETVVNCYPFNMVKNDKQYCLLIFN